MGNIKNYTFDKLKLKLSNSEYWDFTLNSDAIKNVNNYSNNLISSFDFSTYIEGEDYFNTNSNLHNNLNGIISDVKWVDAYSVNFSASTFGLTGTTLVHTSSNDKMVINVVSGSTDVNIYPINAIKSVEDGNYLNFSGGFLQGYYKLHGYDYQVLPTRYQEGFTISTWLRPSSEVINSDTLNSTYPNNKGFFYYNGTRGENKFWNIFSGNTMSACTSASTQMCTEVKETDIIINNIYVSGEITQESVPLSPPVIDVTLIENNFLIFGRSNGKVCGNGDSEDGFGQMRADQNYNKDDKFYSKIIRQEQVNFENKFLTFGRSNGKVCGNGDSEDGFGQMRADQNYSGSTQDVMELDKDKDIIDNAIGFRIRDDGSIGYRLLTLSGDCKSVEVVEEYSDSNLVSIDEWQHILIKWVNNDSYNKCDLINEEPRTGKYKFYVNSNLIFISKELKEFVPKGLYDIQEKQIGVPYNISVGGGTQGLIESLTFDGQDTEDLGLKIEQNFAGSFIGDIKSFDLYNKNLSWCNIKDIYNKGK